MRLLLGTWLLCMALMAQSATLPDLIKNGDQKAIEQQLQTASFSPQQQAEALLAAVGKQSPELVKQFIKHGFDIDSQDAQQMNATALMVAAYGNDIVMTKVLITAGANPNVRDSNGDHALNWAVFAGHQEVTKILVESGARLDIVGHGNAIEIAKRRGFQSLVSYLCAQASCHQPEADFAKLTAILNKRDFSGLTEEHRRAITKLDSTGRPYWHRLVRAGRLEVLQAIRPYIENIDQRDDIGFTALMEAAREGHTDILLWLLKNGASATAISFKNALELTPLHLAAIGGCQICAQHLIAANASIDAQDTAGTTPLLWALSEGKKAMAEFLIEQGASVTLKNKYGYNADMML